MHDSTAVSSKKINLISSEGEVFEVDYDVAVMSKVVEYAIETNSAGDIGSISLSLVNSKMLSKVIEYCKKRSSTQMSEVKLLSISLTLSMYLHGLGLPPPSSNVLT
ncbi:hypothetical protein TSUD_197560 [Trifolium subterraneum]|uniref:SKP1 component POZ domain-containing protein n=1 Tax=Trifolium subterraneum TaxID=3900 RepID=A0A2Z6LJP8_TRISU|nr:hypothetical protein TSUD_197560 [Trifolium subterraneum]